MELPAPRLQVGGNLGLGDLYIRRDEDTKVYDLLVGHEFVNILTSRQMGKSSLMVRLQHRLIDEHGVRIAAVDMAGDLGTPPDRDAWYLGLLEKIALQLELTVDLEAWWQGHASAPPNLRLVQFFTDVVCGEIAGPIVIFLDEIDATLKLDYSDDLFTALRALYNQRATVPVLGRLTFCLIGVAAQRELIKERRTTPYNVGQTVELRDFDAAVDDLGPLQRALAGKGGDGPAVLEALLTWTGGHPFLTMALSRLALERDVRTAADAHRLLAGGVVELDVIRGHLASISKFLETRLSNEAASFQLYLDVLRGRRIRDQAGVAQLELRLSGLVKLRADDRLVVRNKIYLQRFGLAWLRETRPLLVQRRLTWAVIVLSTVLVATVAVVAWQLAKQRSQQRAERARQQRLETAKATIARAPDEALAAAALTQLCGDLTVGKVPPDALEQVQASWTAFWTKQADQLDLLADSRTDDDERTLLHALADVKRGARTAPAATGRAADEALVATIHAHEGPVNQVRFLDATHLVSVGADANVRISDTSRCVTTTSRPVEHVAPRLAVCPDGTCVVTVTDAGQVVRFDADLTPRPPILEANRRLGAVTAVAVDARGERYALAGIGGFVEVRWFDEPNRRSLLLAHADARGVAQAVRAVRFVAGDLVLTAADDGVRLFDVSKDRDERPRIAGAFIDVAASSDGAQLAATRVDQAVTWPRLDPGARVGFEFSGILTVDLSGDGKRVLNAVHANDGWALFMWRVDDLGVPSWSHRVSELRDARLSPDGATVTTARPDGTIAIWRLTDPPADESPLARWRALQCRLGLTVDPTTGAVSRLDQRGPLEASGYEAATCR